jgi:hypothetical protein
MTLLGGAKREAPFGRSLTLPMALLNKLPNRLGQHRSCLPSYFAPGFKQ